MSDEWEKKIFYYVVGKITKTRIFITGKVYHGCVCCCNRHKRSLSNISWGILCWKSMGWIIRKRNELTVALRSEKWDILYYCCSRREGGWLVGWWYIVYLQQPREDAPGGSIEWASIWRSNRWLSVYLCTWWGSSPTDVAAVTSFQFFKDFCRRKIGQGGKDLYVFSLDFITHRVLQDLNCVTLSVDAISVIGKPIQFSPFQ